MSTLTKLPIDADREREIAKARADVMRRARVQGIKPLTSVAAFAGDPKITADFDVDAFLRQVREDRDRTSISLSYSRKATRYGYRAVLK